MRRSNDAVRLAVVPALAAAFLAGCGGEEEETAYCVDQGDTVVENSYCDNDTTGAYFWYFGGVGGSSKSIKKGAKLLGGEKIATNNLAALATKGGFGSASKSSSGVGKGYSASGGGGFFSGGG